MAGSGAALAPEAGADAQAYCEPPTDTQPALPAAMAGEQPSAEVCVAPCDSLPPMQAAARDRRPPMKTEPLRKRVPTDSGAITRALSWPRRAVTADMQQSDAHSVTPLSQDPIIAMEAASDLLMYRSTFSELRRGIENPSITLPVKSTTTIRSLSGIPTADQPAPQREKLTLTPMRLLMAVLLNLVDCINMNILTPYAADMVADLLGKEVNDPEVLQNVGLLIGIYNLSEMIFSPGWGRLSDRYGRRPVILVSLGGAMLVPIVFGLSRSMGMALAVRAVNGILCGSIGITKTYVAELVDKQNEARAFSILTTVYSVGMILGPAMGGMLVNPASWSPAADRFFSQGVWKIFKDEPFLLPNLIFSIMAMIVWVLAFFFLSESLPREEREALKQLKEEMKALKLEAKEAAKVEEGRDSTGRLSKMWDCITTQLPFFVYPVRLLRAMAAYGLAVGYVISTVQNIILLYQVPVQDGGFGFSPARLGMLQNFAALGLLVTQLVLYPMLVRLRGYRWCVIMGLCGVLIVTLPMPLYGLMHDPAKFGGVRMVPVIFMMVVQQAAFGFCTPTTTVWINRFAEGMDRGEVNGWANSFAALCRALAPMCVGFLQGIGNSWSWSGGQYLALYVISFLAISVSALLLPVLPRFKPQKSVTLKVEDDEGEEDEEGEEDSGSMMPSREASQQGARMADEPDNAAGAGRRREEPRDLKQDSNVMSI